MQVLRFIFGCILFIPFFTACVREGDEPPGCESAAMPGVLYSGTEFYEGQEMRMQGIAPAGGTNGTFEWQGPNGYYITSKDLLIRTIKETNEGEYKLFYLENGRCRSKPVVVNIVVHTLAETCGLKDNILRESGTEIYMPIKNIKEETGNNFTVTGSTDSVEFRISFPEKTRPAATRKYAIAQDNSGTLAPGEVSLQIIKEGKSYHARYFYDSRVNVSVSNNKLRIAFCGFSFLNDSNSNDYTGYSANIVVP